MKRVRWDSHTIVIMALLTAMEIVLSRFCSINAWNIKIGFNFLPIVAAAIWLGPLQAGIVAAAGDFIGALLFPIGAYFPGFTVTAFLTGFIFGMFLYEERSALRITAAVAVNQLILSLLLNTFWISVLYGSKFAPLLATRILQCAILIPVQLISISMMTRVLNRIHAGSFV